MYESNKNFLLYHKRSIEIISHWSVIKYIYIIDFNKTIFLTVDADKAVHLIRQMSENWS